MALESVRAAFDIIDSRFTMTCMVLSIVEWEVSGCTWGWRARGRREVQTVGTARAGPFNSEPKPGRGGYRDARPRRPRLHRAHSNATANGPRQSRVLSTRDAPMITRQFVWHYWFLYCHYSVLEMNIIFLWTLLLVKRHCYQWMF